MMCIGIPMQVIEARSYSAICRDGEGEREISTLMVGEVQVGEWVLVSLGMARDKVTEEEALRVSNALDAVSAVMRGEEIDVDTFFPDLKRQDTRTGQT